MSLLNINFGLLAYRDQLANVQPLLRLADIKWSMLGIPTAHFSNVPIALAPGESVTLASTIRALTLNYAVNVSVSNSIMSIACNFGQSVARLSGDETTQWQLVQNQNSVTLTATGGTLPFMNTVNVGDIVSIGAPFSTYNQGDFTVLSKGSNFIQFKNPLATNEIQTAFVPIFSAGPVQVGDKLDISNPAFSFCNQGTFPITRVTPDLIEVLNPNAIEQEIDSVTSGIAAYSFAYKWMTLAVDRKVLIGLNGDAPSITNEVSPPYEGDLVNSPGIMVKRGKIFQMQIMNPGTTQANGFLILAD